MSTRLAIAEWLNVLNSVKRRVVGSISVSPIFRRDLCWSFSFAPVPLLDCILLKGFRGKWGKSITATVTLSWH